MRSQILPAVLLAVTVFLLVYGVDLMNERRRAAEQAPPPPLPTGTDVPQPDPTHSLEVYNPVTFMIERFLVPASETGLEEDFVSPVWITIIPRGRPLATDLTPLDLRERWWEIGNTTTDVYLFAPGTPENVRLILEFVPLVGDQTEARIYVSAGETGLFGTRTVEYSFAGHRFRVLSNRGFPYIRVYPKDGWWVNQQGQTNYNLRVLIDGALPPGGYPYEKQLVDGTVDWEVRVGSIEPGSPSWQTTLIQYDPSPTRAYARFGASTRMPESSPPFRVSDPFMPSFPYLDLSLGSLEIQKKSSERLYKRLRELGAGINLWEKNPSPFYYDMAWQQLQLKGFVGIQTAGSYYYNSYLLPPIISFESPYAFYNFAPDVRTNPDRRQVHLLVRAEYAPLEDSFAHQTHKDRSNLRYAWKTEEEDLWRYNIKMAGSYRYTEEIQIGNISLIGVPPSTYPQWVISKRWPVITFIESVNGTSGSEGIYYYDAQTPQSLPWLDGYQDEVPLYFEVPDLEPGTGLSTTSRSNVSLVVDYRGEYSASYFRKPELYFSPLDQRLHLLHADGGLWYVAGGEKLGDHRILRMHNLRKDAYIDGWTLEYVPAQSPPEGVDIEEWSPRAWPGEIEQALYAFDNYLLYSGAEGTELRQVSDYEPARFTITPPTDAATWNEFRQRLRPFRGRESDPTALREWMDQFDGTTLISSTAPLSTVQATKTGFHFELALPPGFRSYGACQQPGVEPGTYLVFVDDAGGCRFEPAAIPSPQVSVLPATLTRLEPGFIYVRVVNEHSGDLIGVRVVLQPITPGGKESRTLYHTVDLQADDDITVGFQWPPPAIEVEALEAGPWSFIGRAVNRQGLILSSSEPVEIMVTPIPAGNPIDIIRRSLALMTPVLMVLVIGAGTSLMAFAFWQQWSATGPEPALPDAARFDRDGDQNNAN
ncbi:MAG: hypothetical protein HC884_01130 [Chloroflexaceae bacterium]|nr:hypothetical protein [Chloroflexaceae bacterium]